MPSNVLVVSVSKGVLSVAGSRPLFESILSEMKAGKPLVALDI